MKNKTKAVEVKRAKISWPKKVKKKYDIIMHSNKKEFLLLDVLEKNTS